LIIQYIGFAIESEPDIPRMLSFEKN